jgi:hypothetical protein
MTTPLQILAYALHTMRAGQRIIVDSFNRRDRILIHEEFYDKDQEYITFISNYTNNQEFVEDTDTISRIIYTTFNILKIKKVYANGNTNVLYDHLNQSRLLPTPRRSRIQ